ncbi:MAG TPA: hypothetical protein VEZ15_16245 [Acidimicrobiia bacterium]|nr:hypothetical protein [Acidimicrobiia bacterium]
MTVSGLRARAGTYGGVFMVTLATLMYEIALTRIFSVTMWYHFAFGVISLALFGMTAGALIVHLHPGRFPDDAAVARLWFFSLLFGVSIPVCFLIQLFIPVNPKVTLGGIFSVALTCVVVSIPFVFSGVVVCLVLTRFPARVNRLYAADLIGAALGCVLFVFLVGRVDAPSVVVATGALATLGALFFAFDLAEAAPKLASGVCVVLIGGLAIGNAALHASNRDPLRIRYVKGSPDHRHLYEKWNAFSRITVDGMPNDPASQTLGMVIDSTAGTGLYRYTGSSNATTHALTDLRDDVTNLVHHVRRNADVLVIGVGGGRDILSALLYGQHSVKGVEINKDILHVTNRVYGAFTGHLDRDPRVSFVNDEARAYLARTSAKYDIIQISLIDTWAATSSGAFALSENSLYTTHAWKIFLDRLKPGGILSVTRWYRRPLDAGQPLEMYRTTSLAAQALKERGVHDPRSHIAIYEGPPLQFSASLGTLLVSPQPIPQSSLTTLQDVAGRLHYTAALTPGSSPDHVFGDLTGPGGPHKGIAEVRADISPPTDNRPFFFQMADIGSLGDVFSSSNDQVFQPVLVLAVLSLTVLVLTAAFILFPLLRTTRRAEHRGMGPFYVYFAGIGLAFLLIEVSQLQRLAVFLGHPTYGLTVVLFSVLLFSGIGSMLTERIAARSQQRSSLVALGSLLVVVIAFGVVSPQVLRATEHMTTPARIGVAVALLAPLSLMMGMPFALGMRLAATRPGATTAFMWGINGAMSVCGSVFGLVLALFFGISTAFWVGLLAYALAFAAMTRMAPPRGEPSTVVSIAGEPQPVAVPAP